MWQTWVFLSKGKLSEMWNWFAFCLSNVQNKSLRKIFCVCQNKYFFSGPFQEFLKVSVIELCLCGIIIVAQNFYFHLFSIYYLIQFHKDKFSWILLKNSVYRRKPIKIFKSAIIIRYVGISLLIRLCLWQQIREIQFSEAFCF